MQDGTSLIKSLMRKKPKGQTSKPEREDTTSVYGASNIKTIACSVSFRGYQWHLAELQIIFVQNNLIYDYVAHIDIENILIL